MHYLTGLDREQAQIFTKLEDLVSARHYVRLIDLLAERFFIENDSIFCEKGEQNIGRKAYSPAYLLKLYIYGYLNGISSSRKLERECTRNLELMWLMNQLIPDHKTIADFRKDNSEAIKQSVLTFGKWLQQSAYIKGDCISIDGSKIRANASRSFDLDHVSKKLEQLDAQLQEYMAKISRTDQVDEECEQAEKEKEQLHQYIKELQQQINELELKKALLDQEQAKRISPTDPQARVMKSRQGKHFCYNVQVVVDEKHKLILCNQVYNHENDKGLLKPMVEQAEEALDQSPKEVLADAGYHQMNQLEELENRGIECYVAINENQEQVKEAEHGIVFEYNEAENIYRCSQGQSLVPQFGTKRDNRRGTEAQAYKGTNCQPCSIKKACTKSDTARSVYRFTNQQWRDRYKSKLKSEMGISKLKLRKCLSEHPFGTMKCWMGHIPILLRGEVKVQTEINIYAIAYNFKRMLNVASFEDLEKMFRPIQPKISLR
jgi:transposase